MCVDEIIRVSGGSKSSLYKFFGSKENILKEIIESLAEDMLREIDFPVTEDQPPEVTHKRIGLHIGSMALSTFAVNQYRLAVSNANLFPKIARLWYESGPGKVFSGLTKYIWQGKMQAAGCGSIARKGLACFFSE